MRATGDSTYGDSMERVLYNTILGAKPIRPDGVSFYYSDYNMDAVKSNYEEKWPCCSGTFPQITADYGISSYMRSPKGLYVNFYVPSRVTWRQGDARVTLTQETQYPTIGETSLKLTMDRQERFVVALQYPCVGWKGHDGGNQWKDCRRSADAGKLGRAGSHLEDWRSRRALARYAIAPGSIGRATRESGGPCPWPGNSLCR